ncbi:MAG: polysaccharide biosynthesis/export family protein [Gemmatimonadaceae bacterium]
MIHPFRKLQRSRRPLARTIALLTLVLFARAGHAQQADGSSQRLTLSPGDVIRLEVWQQKAYSGEFPVANDGTVVHPLYRELRVAGRPLNEVDGMFRDFLSRFLTNPTFSIQPLLRVVVAGEVRQPNIYTVPPGTTVAQVIAMAGGPTDRGRLDDIRVIRNATSTKLDLTRPDATATHEEIHSGDEILMGRRRNIMQDIVAPSSSILAALASITGVIIQVTRKP